MTIKHIYKKVLFSFVFLAIFSTSGFAKKIVSTRPKGISATFIKRLEVMSEDSWKSKPLRKEKAAKNISRYDAIFSANFIASYNRKAWNYIRKYYPETRMFYYASGDTTSIQRGGYIDYDYISTFHPEWFLLADARKPVTAAKNIENRIRWNSRDKKSVYYNRFYLDVANKEFQEWAAEEFLKQVLGKKQRLMYPYDGFAMDNVHIGDDRMGTITRRHGKWKYSNDIGQWNKGFFEYLKTVKRKLNDYGFLLLANHSMNYGVNEEEGYWKAFLESVDGVITEQSLRYHRVYYSDLKWLSSLSKHERILKSGLIDWWICYVPEKEPKGYDGFMYTYCSWLLVQKPGKSFYHARKLFSQPGSELAAPWFEEYELPLGESLSSRYPKNNCWLRDYTNAKVVVNPSKKTQTIVLDDKKQWLEWKSKKLITVLEAPPMSGTILLPTAY